MQTKFLYIETDGMVYLVEREGKLKMPLQSEKLPFDVEQKYEMQIRDHIVIFCKPHLKHHPRDWYHKDIIPGMDEVDPIARLAVNMTHPRVVTEAVIIREGKILLVKPNRGFNLGYWTLPGGFVSYGEPPEEAIKREVLEEVGLSCKIKRLIAVETFVGKKSYFTWQMFFYEAAIHDGPFNPAADEIEEVRWFELRDGLNNLQGVKKAQLEKYLLV